MIGIIGAMDQEIHTYLQLIDLEKRTDWNGSSFYQGTLFNTEAVIVRTGVGKVLAAMVTQKLFDSYDIHRVIFTGIAGSLNVNYEIGDIVIASDTVQHDMNATALGFKRGLIPYANIDVIKCDKNWHDRLAQAATRYGNVYSGRILTGDIFLADRENEQYRYLREELNGDAVEMEGASVGIVCHVNNVPFNLIRIISDKADGASPSNFNQFLENASNTSGKILSEVL